ncbi:MAG: PIG-L family deacetylase [Kiritimatiellae bacterium]|nr:PIG-L family deacetylase [Kiritimatiellia bacterium]MDD5521293.1 PIG-L family deacetylase [Kiritimatiellia bacterium]
MKFNNSNAEVYVPDGLFDESALKRTTHIGFGAHQDDLEILAFHGILECLNTPGKWFTGVTCTDGAGSPRIGRYANFTNEQMQETRWQEQRHAASIGRYSSVIQLKYASSAIKDPKNRTVPDDFRTILSFAKPTVIYTHNLTDKHDTHVGVVLKLISMLRELSPEKRPEKVYGVEIWRDLDWMPDKAKVVLDVSGADHTAAALLGVYDSQIAGGKRYDLATMGRWRANATYFESHGVDTTQMTSFAMDLTPLITNKDLDIVDYATDFVSKFKDDVVSRLRKHITQ